MPDSNGSIKKPIEKGEDTECFAVMLHVVWEFVDALFRIQAQRPIEERRVRFRQISSSSNGDRFYTSGCSLWPRIL
jgi:hypothetical protein